MGMESISSIHEHRSVGLTIGQVAAMLGVSTDTARRLTDAGAFPNAYRVSKHRRVPKSDVDALANRKRLQTGGAK